MNTLQLLTFALISAVSLSSAFVVGRMVGETSSSAGIADSPTK